MRSYNLSHLADAELLRRLASLVVRHQVTTAVMLAHIAEVDRRGLYLPLGYSSMHAYCTERLHLSDAAASKRIQAARLALRHPQLLDMVADGRLHLSAICVLAPHVTPENFDALVALAIHRGRRAIERALAERLEADWLAGVAAVAAATPAPAPAGPGSPEAAAPAPSIRHAPGHVGTQAQTAAAPPVRVIRVELTPELHDKLRRAQELLAHAVPDGDVAAILDRALDALISTAEGRKFATTERPRGSARKSPTAPRTVPARVRRAVAARDETRCAFVGADGHRCATRRRLEFDHVRPVARGGTATVDGMRLLCRAHNQYEAERVFGRDFMQSRRGERVQERPGDVPRGTSNERDIPTPGGSGEGGVLETTPEARMK